MTNHAKLETMCQMLAQRYGQLGEKAGERLRDWLDGDIPYAYPEVLAQHLDETHLALLLDAFWQVLPFGTGGRRGPVGYGPNRLNPSTVAMTVQGHSQYLQRQTRSGELAVVVANDVRVFRDNAGVYGFLGNDHPMLGVSSRSLARLACEIYAGNGIIAYLAEPENDHAVISTPELSFFIVQLHGAGGINLSASHNPPDDNGIKVYDSFGSQPVAPEDQRLADAMELARDIRRLPFAEGRESELIRGVPKELHQGYIETYLRAYDHVYQPRADLPIVYTPLCGCGVTTVGDVLSRLGFRLLIPEDQRMDGSFAVIPFKAPNPEVPEATSPAKAFAEQHQVDIVLSSDPDADRVGLEIRLADRNWYHFDGNQIAAILCYFLMLDAQGPRRRGLVIETLVTTKILGRIVAEVGDSWIIDDLLVGFKYVADVLKTLEREGRYANVSCSPGDLVIAAEESHGVVVVPGIRDKDATPACMYLAALYQRLYDEGRTLLDYYAQILRELGGYDNVNRGITLAGAEGMLKKDRIMSSLREDPPDRIGGLPVRNFVDYWDQERFGPFRSNTDRLPRNVLQVFTDNIVITIRPSGTEPKLKFYCQLLPNGEPVQGHGTQILQGLRTRADGVSAQIYNELLLRIDESLGGAALLLPDIIDLERKKHFEQTTMPGLHKALRSQAGGGLEGILDWLRQESAQMTPGADPLPALKRSVGYLCRTWRNDPGMGLVQELEHWAAH
jgi:phosphoglucomutase